MADTPTFSPNPYANFDPSQYTNPYSNFFGKALPWPSSYAGAPTNALGQPIQPPQGMTLNSTPAQPQAPAAAPPQQQMGWNPGYLIDSRTGLPSQNGSGDRVGQGMFSFDPQTVAHLAPTVGNKAMFGAAVGGQQQAAPQAVAPAAPNNWQNTLSMLANPGHVTTPGATVPQAQGSTGVQPGVLQNFLANWKPQQSGAGSGFTQNFNSILRGLQAQKGS